MYRLLFLLICSPCLAVAQQNQLTHAWTTGNEIYSGRMIDDSTCLFEGGNLHEGGASFSIVIRKDGSMYITKTMESEYSTEPSIGKIDDQVQYRELNGTPVLLIRGTSGTTIDVLRQMKPAESLQDLTWQSMVNYGLAGRYRNTSNKKEINFYPGERKVTGLAATSSYRFEEEYDFPVQVMTFAGKQSFYYEITDKGLDIYSAKPGGDYSWDKGRKLFSLEKIYWYNVTGDTSLKGHYAFASTYVLTADILTQFSRNQLKLIRNEIFARHGYRFNSAEWKNYFSRQSWYTPLSASVDDKLTELEKLNIILLQQWEEQSRNNADH